MSTRTRHLLAAAILLGSGALRLLWEPALTQRYQNEGLLSPPLDVGVREKVSQATYAVVLGGLRTLASTIVYLGAYDKFATQRWADLERIFETTVTISPNSRYYWDLGAWHMAKNAASYYQSESKLNPIRARAERLRWYEKGRSFLERGVRNNPRDGQLHLSLAQLYEDPFLFPDDKLACAEYEKAIALGVDSDSVKRAYLRALFRSGSDPHKAHAMLNELLAVRENRLPTLLCLKYVTLWEERQKFGAPDPLKLCVEVFDTEDRAFRMLGPYYTSVRDRWPQDGVELTLRILEQRRGISPDSPKSNIRMREEDLANMHELDERGVVPGMEEIRQQGQ